MDKLPVDRATAERFLLGPDEITVLASCADTNDDLFAVEVRMHPGGDPPVMHRHAPSEIYFVQSGEFAFYVGEGDAARRVTARSGDIVPLAGGTAHTIRNEGTVDAVALVVHAPGRPMESFSRAAAALAEQGRTEMAAVLDVAARSGIELLGPIPVLD
jgi:mannose-6-phosphate isomerase-like protein (cupin superfamily)